MKTEKEIKERIENLKEDFFRKSFSQKELGGGTKITLRMLKGKIEELYWVLEEIYPKKTQSKSNLHHNGVKTQCH